jgi:PAS domain S-box-containing protein
MEHYIDYLKKTFQKLKNELNNAFIALKYIKQKDTKSLTFKYMVPFLFLVVLLTADYLLLNNYISTNQKQAMAFILTADQRMLTQRIALISREITKTKEEERINRLSKQLIDSIKLLESTHNTLTNKNKMNAAPSIHSEKIHSIYFEPPHSLDLQISTFLEKAKAVAFIPSKKISAKDKNLIYILTTATDEKLLFGLEELIHQHEKESEEFILNSKKLNSLLFLLNILVIIFIVSYVFRPLTKRIENEVLALQESNKFIENLRKQNELILNAAGEGIFGINKEGLITFVNSAGATMVGWSIPELIGKYPHEIIHHTKVDGSPCLKSECPIYESLKDGNSYHTDNELFWKKDGIAFPVEYLSTPIKENEELIGAVIIYRDITEQRKEQQSKNRLASIVESSEDAILGLSLKGNIENWNDGAVRSYGYSKEEAFNKNVSIIFPNDNLGEIDVLLGRIKNGEHINHFETIRKKKDGSLIYVSQAISPIKDYENKVIGVSSIERDISEKKISEEKLNNVLLELERSNKELEQFAYITSHDLQEPLRTIISYSQLTQEIYADKLDEKGKQFLNYASEGAQRMQNLINDLLEYSRIEKAGTTFEPTVCNEIVKTAITNLNLSISESKAEVICDDLPIVMGDKIQLIQLFQNLIGNAIKYRGKLSPKIFINATKKENIWFFSVKDNGIGFNSEYAEQIFLIFQRLHSRKTYKGSGIGLALCKRIVERHGGTIWAESEPEKGSIFNFTIPSIKG